MKLLPQFGERKEKEIGMEIRYYTVESIDGDYAYLKRTDAETDDLKCVARALLPEAITEGCTLRYEMMQYSIQ